MKTAIHKDVPALVLADFERIVAIQRALPDLSENLTCHALCRAYAVHLPFLCVYDGFFRSGYEHSWLTIKTRTEHFKGWVIDVYPWVLLGGPILVPVEGLSPWRTLYRPADEWLARRLVISPKLVEGFDEASAAIGAVLAQTPWETL